MDSVLRLIILHLSVVMINGNDFRVSQPSVLAAVVGNSIIIHCSFTYPENYTPQKIDISWRRHNFHGEFIFNISKGYTHPDYRGRIEFLGFPYKEKTGSIRIDQLKLSDSNRYFCRVATSGHTPERWQNIPGTWLTVQAWKPTPKPTTEPTTKSAGSATWMPVLIGCSVLAFLLISLGLVAAVCSWKKQQHQHENIRQVSLRDVSALSKNRSIDLDQQQKDPSIQSQPKNAPAGKENDSEGIVYAALHVKESSGTTINALSSEGHIVYAAVKFHAETN